MKNKISVKDVLNAFHITERARYEDIATLPRTLQKLASCQFNQGALEQVLIRRYALSHFFIGMLERMRDVIKNGEKGSSKIQGVERAHLLLAVTKNLQEELGENEQYGGPHINSRINFLKHLGYDYDALYGSIGSFNNPIRSSVLTQREPYVEFINSVRDLFTCGGKDLGVAAVTVLWYWENRISLGDELGDYCLLLNAFEKGRNGTGKTQKEYKETEPFYHLWSHAKHDPFHAKDCRDPLSALPDEYAPLVAEICNRMRMLTDKYWEDIYPS